MGIVAKILDPVLKSRSQHETIQKKGSDKYWFDDQWKEERKPVSEALRAARNRNDDASRVKCRQRRCVIGRLPEDKRRSG
jgi:mevalonate pyrophosphate decarboxylase